MSEPIDHLKNELVRLASAVDILVATLRNQRAALERAISERNELKAQLDIADAKFSCLVGALKISKDNNLDAAENVVDLASSIEKRRLLH